MLKSTFSTPLLLAVPLAAALLFPLPAAAEGQSIGAAGIVSYQYRGFVRFSF